MTGRDIDQILPRLCEPDLHEDYVQSAMDYVRLAESANGPIHRGVDPDYIWGASLDEFARMEPDARIINLETSITRSEDYASKGINYRMSPENADCLKAAATDCCVLGNNHILVGGATVCLIRCPHLSISTSNPPVPTKISLKPPRRQRWTSPKAVACWYFRSAPRQAAFSATGRRPASMLASIS